MRGGSGRPGRVRRPRRASRILPLASPVCLGRRSSRALVESCRTAGSGTGRAIRYSLKVLAPILMFCSLLAQESSPPAPDLSRNPDAFPNVFNPYRSRELPEPLLVDGVDLAGRVTDGVLRLSIQELRSAVLENNLDIAAARYVAPMAETDILRARGGGAPRGIPGARIPTGLFAGAIGAGVGDTTTAGGFTGAGGITGSARQVFARPRGSYDPSIAFNLSLDRTTTPLNTVVVAGVPSVQTSTAALQTRYAQAFSTGTSLSVSFNNQRQNSTQRFLRFNPSVVSSFSVVVTQQLLNGFGSDVNRRFLTVAENGEEIAKETIRQQVITTLAQAERAYWDLVAARENVRVAENALSVASQLLEENRLREEIGTLSPIEVVTAASEVAARRRDLVGAQTIADMREFELKNVLTRQSPSALASVRLEPTDELPDPRKEISPLLEDALVIALDRRPALRQANINLANQEVAIRYTRNLLKPTLLVFGLVNSAGLSGNQILELPTGPATLTGGFPEALCQVGRFSYPEYAVGLSLQIPILNRSAQADNIRARIDKQQAELSMQQLSNQVRLEVRSAVVAMTQSSAQVESARKAVEFSELSLHEEQEKLLAGLSTPYNVIRRQRDLLAAQVQEIRARSDYAKARVDLDEATGRTAEK